jgi:hypothetical protein
MSSLSGNPPPPPDMQVPPPPRPVRTMRIVGLVLLSGVVLCGLCGTCLFVLTLLAPVLGL